MVELRRLALDAGHELLVGELPPAQRLDAAAFEALWSIHPSDFHEIVMHGRPVRTPRWQQAYGADYHYTGNTNRALPLVPPMPSWLAWAREQLDPRLNGLLLNWYDGEAGHYIGKHRDRRRQPRRGLADRHALVRTDASVSHASLARRGLRRRAGDGWLGDRDPLGDQPRLHPRGAREQEGDGAAHLRHAAGLSRVSAAGLS